MLLTRSFTSVYFLSYCDCNYLKYVTSVADSLSRNSETNNQQKKCITMTQSLKRIRFKPQKKSPPPLYQTTSEMTSRWSTCLISLSSHASGFLSAPLRARGAETSGRQKRCPFPAVYHYYLLICIDIIPMNFKFTVLTILYPFCSTYNV